MRHIVPQIGFGSRSDREVAGFSYFWGKKEKKNLHDGVETVEHADTAAHDDEEKNVGLILKTVFQSWKEVHLGLAGTVGRRNLRLAGCHSDLK